MSEDRRVYGTRVDEIHPFFREKREWSKVKDKILKDYITCYLRTIHRRGRPIIIVDAFSGPGRFGDGLEGSPLIICGAIDNAPKRGVGVACLFSDSHPAHRDAFEACMKERRPACFANSPQGVRADTSCLTEAEGFCKPQTAKLSDEHLVRMKRVEKGFQDCLEPLGKGRGEGVRKALDDRVIGLAIRRCIQEWRP